MKKPILHIFLIIIGFSSYSQNELKSVKLSDEFSWKNHSQSEFNEFYFKVQPLKKSIYKYHFRHQRDGQIIDIYSKNGESFSGKLLNLITKYKDIRTGCEKGSKADSYIFEIVKLNSVNATKVGKLILNRKFYSIPTDTLIDGWNFDWLDCGAISFSFKIGKNFQFSEFSSHSPQNDSIEYISMIKSMYDTIGQILNLNNRYSEFESMLEKGKTYSRNGFTMMYVMTEKQHFTFQKSKPQREYLKSIKDTIDNYLESEIAKQKVRFNEIDCFEDYKLTFHENGKLEKVTASGYDKPKLSDGLGYYFEDKREIRECKKLIKQIFKEIDLSSFNLKYKIYRTLSFGLKNEVDLGGKMNY